MKQVKMRTLVLVFTIIIGLTFISRRPLERLFDRLDLLDFGNYAIEIVDDSGYRIKMKTYPERIISLHPAHTSNLYHLGLEHQIVGVHKADVLPLDAIEKAHFDPMGDAGPILKEEPDLILITPQIERDNPNMVNQLRRSGMRVFSIYPQNMADIERYFLTLGKVTGKQNTAVKYYHAFEAQKKALEADQPVVESPYTIYYEISEMKQLSASKDSIQDFALGAAGANLYTLDGEAYEMTIHGSYDQLKDAKNEVQWIFTEQGGADSGGSAHSIAIRPGYETLKAIGKKQVIEVDFRSLGLPSMELFEGIKDLRRILYPEIYGKVEIDNASDLLTREKFAAWLVKRRHLWTYYPNYSYFKTPDRGHYYGHYEDVPMEHPMFKAIETCVQAGYLKGRFDEDGVEWFDPELPITRDQLALALFLAYDVEASTKEVTITDLSDSENERIVERLVGLGIFRLDSEGKFHPQTYVTEDETINAFEKMEELTHD